MDKKFKINGFTLIELIVVIGIISILALTVLTVLDPFAQFEKSTDARRKEDLSQIQKAFEVYYGDHGRYPVNTTSYTIQSDGGTSINWGSSWQPYMNVVPSDPDPTHQYQYFSSSDGQAYWLYANLSRGSKDPQVCNGGNVCTSINTNGITPNCGGICNFGVSSPNTSP